MITINLIPEESKQKATRKTIDIGIPIIPLLMGVGCVMVALPILLMFWVGQRKSTLAHLRKQVQSFNPQVRALSKVKSEIKNIDRKIKLIEELTGREVLVAKLLNGLSDAMLPDVWLSKLSYSEGSTMIIEGYATNVDQGGTATVGKFINSLKHNKDFGSYFQDVRDQDVRRTRVQELDVMKFKLVCVHKKK